MITDKIKNIERYNIPKEALLFIKNLTSDIAFGKYEITKDIYANVESYNTKLNGKFERHRKYVDVQILLLGKEKIYYTDVENLDEYPFYDEVKDISFYDKEIVKSHYVILDGTNFSIIYPNEAHAPQIFYEKQEPVKKVVVKIKYSSLF
ncbi:YhcH/YjgK/YiaL family protein [bacterium]|nr:YhcH/YjgK/YiaL family protein [bacterium]